MQLSGWPLVKGWLRFLAFRLSNTWCIWNGAARSFAGHIRIQSSKERLAVDLGPAPVLTPDGSLIDQPATRARVASIENLSAKYPWIDIVDRRIFLMGFDAGEQTHDRCHVNETDRQVELPS
jgi:hypothetical protein